MVEEITRKHSNSVRVETSERYGGEPASPTETNDREKLMQTHQLIKEKLHKKAEYLKQLTTRSTELEQGFKSEITTLKQKLKHSEDQNSIYLTSLEKERTKLRETLTMLSQYKQENESLKVKLRDLEQENHQTAKQLVEALELVREQMIEEASLNNPTSQTDTIAFLTSKLDEERRKNVELKTALLERDRQLRSISELNETQVAEMDVEENNEPATDKCRCVAF
jgi:leucyl aminopeptidase